MSDLFQFIFLCNWFRLSLSVFMVEKDVKREHACIVPTIFIRWFLKYRNMPAVRECGQNCTGTCIKIRCCISYRMAEICTQPRRLHFYFLLHTRKISKLSANCAHASNLGRISNNTPFRLSCDSCLHTPRMRALRYWVNSFQGQSNQITLFVF